MAFLDIIIADQHSTFTVPFFFSSHSLAGFISSPAVVMDTNTSDPLAQYFRLQFPQLCGNGAERFVVKLQTQFLIK